LLPDLDVGVNAKVPVLEVATVTANDNDSAADDLPDPPADDRVDRRARLADDVDPGVNEKEPLSARPVTPKGSS
jgi:hypothetical protein